MSPLQSIYGSSLGRFRHFERKQTERYSQWVTIFVPHDSSRNNVTEIDWSCVCHLVFCTKFGHRCHEFIDWFLHFYTFLCPLEMRRVARSHPSKRLLTCLLCNSIRDRNLTAAITNTNTNTHSAKGVVSLTPDYDHCLYLRSFSFVYFFFFFAMHCRPNMNVVHFILLPLFIARSCVVFRKIKMSVAFAHTQTHTKKSLWNYLLDAHSVLAISSRCSKANWRKKYFKYLFFSI